MRKNIACLCLSTDDHLSIVQELLDMGFRYTFHPEETKAENIDICISAGYIAPGFDDEDEEICSWLYEDPDGSYPYYVTREELIAHAKQRAELYGIVPTTSPTKSN